MPTFLFTPLSQWCRSSILVLGIAIFAFLSFSSTAWGAGAACTGSASGKAGTCTAKDSCFEDAESPVFVPSNAGPLRSPCLSGEICCIPSDTTPPPLGKACSVSTSSSSGTVTRTGACQFPSQCPTGSQSAPATICTGGTECCYTAPSAGLPPGTICGGGNGTCVATITECSNAGGSISSSSECGLCCITGGGSGVNECEGVGGRCARVSDGCTGGETPSSRSCGTSTTLMCCNPPVGSVNECTTVPGARCATVTGGCVTGETPSTRSCGTSTTLMCCDRAGGTGGGGTGGTPPTTGGACPGTAGEYTKIAGVCFPTKTGLSDKSVIDIIAALLSWLLGIFGFIALIGFIISGLQYLFSAGNENMAETAKRNMKYAIIGIIVALSGFIMIQAIDTLLRANSLI